MGTNVGLIVGLIESKSVYVDNQHKFLTVAERDAFFNNDISTLKNGLFCLTDIDTTPQMWRYNGNAKVYDSKKWKETNSAIVGGKGEKGDTGQGVCIGGDKNQILSKKTNADFDTEWVDIPSVDIGNLDDWKLPDMDKKVPNVQQTGQLITEVKDIANEALDEASNSSKELVTFRIKESKVVDVNDLNHHLLISRTWATPDSTYDERVEFAEFKKTYDSDPNFNLWDATIYLKNDISYIVKFFHQPTDEYTSETKDPFITHSGRRDRIINLDLMANPLIPDFSYGENGGNATLDKIKSSIAEKILVRLHMPVANYDLSKVKIWCEDKTGNEIGRTDINSFTVVKDTLVANGFMYVAPDYEAFVVVQTDTGYWKSPMMNTIGARDSRVVIVDINGKYTMFTGAPQSAIYNHITEEVNKSNDMLVPITVLFPNATYNVKDDTIRFVSEVSKVPVYSVYLKDVRNETDMTSFNAFIQSDVYGHFELVSNKEVLAKSAPMLSQGGRSNYEMFADYTNKTFGLDSVPEQGTIDLFNSGGGSGGVSIHNKLQEIQGGKADEYYHLDRNLVEMNLKQNKGIFNASKIYNIDSRKQISNLISQTEYEITYGNRTHGNILFSGKRDQLKHIWNEDKVMNIQNSMPANPVQKKTYTFSIPVFNNSLKNQIVSKFSIFTGSDKTAKKSPDKGRIDISNKDGESIYSSCPPNQTAELVDSYGNFYGELIFDIRDYIKVLQDDIFTVSFTVDSDYILGGENPITEVLEEPSITITCESLFESPIADLGHIRELVPTAFTEDGYFEFGKLDEQSSSVLYFKTIDELEIYPFGKLVVPTMFENRPIVALLDSPDNKYGALKEFRAESLIWFGYEDTTREESFFKNHPNLKMIYLPNLTEIGCKSFLDNCPEIEIVYVPKLTTFDDGINFIKNCPKVKLIIGTKSKDLIKWCVLNNVNYDFADTPTTSGNEINEGFILTVGKDKVPEWQPQASNAFPYLTINNVLDDIGNTTSKGTVINVEIIVKLAESIKNPLIALDFGLYSYTTPLIFDGKAKWYFEFPFDPKGSFKVGDEVTYQLSWQDQNAMNYTGFEKVKKSIVI